MPKLLRSYGKLSEEGNRFFYVTDGEVVYQIFIDGLDHIVEQTYMTRVEGENTRLRHPPRSLTSKDFMLFKVYRDLEDIRSLVASLPKVLDYSNASVFHYTPKHSSWLNQIELWFSILVRKLLRRASFRSQADLKARILEFINYFNRTMALAV